MNQENITRTLATGLSDITRHEAYTKATGLNESNAGVPIYEKEQGGLPLDEMLEILKKSMPNATKVILVKPNIPGDVHDTTSAFIGVMTRTESGEGAEEVVINEIPFIIESEIQNAHILMNCSVESDAPILYDFSSVDFVKSQCNGRLYIMSQTISSGIQIKKISTEDFTQLYNLSVDLIDTEMDLYFSLSTK